MKPRRKTFAGRPTAAARLKFPSINSRGPYRALDWAWEHRHAPDPAGDVHRVRDTERRCQREARRNPARRSAPRIGRAHWYRDPDRPTRILECVDDGKQYAIQLK